MEEKVKYRTEIFTSTYERRINNELEKYLNDGFEVISIVFNSNTNEFVLFVKKKIYFKQNQIMKI